MPTHTHIQKHICINRHTLAFTSTCTHKHAHTHIYLHAHMHILTYTYSCTHTHRLTSLHMHTITHKHVHVFGVYSVIDKLAGKSCVCACKFVTHSVSILKSTSLVDTYKQTRMRSCALALFSFTRYP